MVELEDTSALSTVAALREGSSPSGSIYTRDGTGIRVGFKHRILRVQISPGVPSARDGIGIHTCLRSKVLRVRLPSGVLMPDYSNWQRECAKNAYSVGSNPTSGT